METRDVARDNIEKLAELFPEVVKEAADGKGGLARKVDLEALAGLLGQNALGDDEERYDFTWAGKKAAAAEAGAPIRKTLRPCVEESKDWENTENLYIEGDNLEALKPLQESYLGAVKMIYIDPPYNTGNDFIYKDDFRMSAAEYDESSGAVNDEGDRLFRNNDSNGRFHSDWCSMIYSRLKLARNLLSDDGVIFISIDDNEAANLKKICDEVFGESNFVAQFPWRKRTAKSDVPFGVSQDYELIICIAKSSKFMASILGKERKYYESSDFPNRPWRIHDLTKQTTASERPNSFFTIINPKTGEQYPANPNRTWAITQETYEQYYSQNRIIFPGDYEFLKISKPVLRYWKEDDMKKAGEKFGRVAVSTKLPDEIGMSQDGTKEVTRLFNAKIFNFPKPSMLVKFLVNTSTNDDSIILDFFSGSATTAHAVMQLNAEDGGNRNFIMVQLPEKCDEKSEAYKAGYKNVCEIGKERIRRAGEKIKAEIEKENMQLKIDEEPKKVPDIGFRVFKIDSTNMKDVYYGAAELSQVALDELVSNIKEDRSDLDLLFGAVTDLGLPLSERHEVMDIEGYRVHNYCDLALVACFEENVPESVIRKIASLRSEAAGEEPARVVFRDSSFPDDPGRINVEEIFKLMAPTTEVRVI